MGSFAAGSVPLFSASPRARHHIYHFVSKNIETNLLNASSWRKSPCLYSMTTDGFLGPQAVGAAARRHRCLVDLSSSASAKLGREVLQERSESNSRQHFRPGDGVRLNA